MRFLNYVGFEKYKKEDIIRIVKWIVISYLLIGLGLIIQFLVFKLTYIEFTDRVHTITLRGFIGYGIYALIQEIVARGLFQQWMKKITKSSFWSIFITTTIFFFFFLYFN